MDVPVVVAGGGSVGLSLAAELGWRGVECVVVEERETLNRHPRANAVANRTMEYYRRWGIDDAITRAGIPPSLPAEYLWVTTLHGREIHRVSLPPFDELVLSRGSGDYAEDEHLWSPYLKTITGQDEVESVLLDFVRTRPELDVRFGWRLVGFEETVDSMLCRVEQTSTGRTQTIDAAYLVGCDGGRSTVRRQLGIGLEGRSDLASFVSVYFHAPDMINHHRFGHGNIFFPLHRDHRGFLLTWDDDRTYTYHLVLDRDQEWTSIDPIEAIRSVVGADFDIEIRSIQPWTAHALVAKAYRRGRAFLAGDAAHLFSPTGGFGMNTGVSDAIDLAWKLEATLAGWAGPGLLDSYDGERRPIGHRNTKEAADCFDRLFAVMHHGDVLDDDGAAGDAVRAALTVDIKDQEKLVASSGTLLGYRYEDSNIVIADGTLPTEDDPRRYVPTARPGHRAPHLWLDNGDALQDQLGKGFNLVLMGKSAAADHVAGVKALLVAAQAIGLPIDIVSISEPEVHAIYEAEMTLIRPDLMVAWRGSALPDDVAALLDVVRGA